MSRTRLVITCTALLAVAACGTPTERCETRVAAETRNVSQLLQQVEANIARGYTWETETTQGGNFRLCAGGFRGGNSGLGVGYSSCYGGPDTLRKRVAIDPAAEARKRDALQKRLAALSSGGAAQCVSRYGAAP